ncbi:hypothetical protein [uncultured Amnibacterium sp.]|uniref:hypothetical protein n=1 Tax=uncultured Amnibacterium sp. TaxID=1631851 RepID=UPI0035CC941B
MVTKQRTKELNALRADASQLWSDQQAVLSRATGVAREASKQAGHLSREEWAPRAKTTYADRVGPAVTRGAEFATTVAAGANNAVFNGAVPAVASAAAAAAALGGTARGRVTDAAGKAGSVVTKQGAKLTGKGAAKVAGKGAKGATKAAKTVAGSNKGRDAVVKAAKGAATVKVAQKALPTKKSGPGTGSIVGLTLGILALIGIGYAVWQTLRADDDLWVADDEPEIAPGTDTPVA